MTATPELTRRQFLRASAMAGGGLLVSVSWPASRATGAPAESVSLNAYVLIGSDGRVTLFAPVPEIGQGVRTALPMILAEELRADWSQVHIEQASADPRYGPMAVGGSDSVADYWEPLRLAGASARERLISAAAAHWQVPREECRAERGTVFHVPSGRRIGYGALAEEAARQPEPASPPLTDPDTFGLIGSRTPRVDTPDIVTGRAVFGIDVRRPSMRHAVLRRPPVHGGVLRRFDGTAALAVPGVEQVVEIERLLLGGYRYGAVRGGVAVIARDTWTAIQGREALDVEWDDGRFGRESTETIHARMQAAPGSARSVVRNQGERPSAVDAQGRTLSAEYELPALAHVCLEPMNFTAHVREGRCDLWGPTQQPRDVRELVAAALHLPESSVHVHPTLEGGGFGRRLAIDYAVEAALVARAVDGPCQVLWTRDDDLRHDYYRSPSLHRMEALLDGNGAVVSWKHHLINAPLLDHISGPGAEHAERYDMEGAANLPYDIPNIRVEYTPVDIGLQMGSWRSVSHSFNVFAVNTFLDEIAATTKMDPLHLHLRLLGEPRQVQIELPLPGRRGRPSWHTGRLRRVLEIAAERAGWGRPLPAGWGRGIACCYFKETYVAHVAEVSTDERAGARVQRIVAAIDCGRVVNPDGVEAQVEGAAIDGLATVFHWEITLENGRVREANFEDYPLARMDEAPVIETHIVASEEEPSGTGEPPYPSVAPAICNAIYAATGTRIRRLPVAATDLSSR